MPRANPDKGEATLGGKLFRMNFGAWRAFEHSSDRKISDHMLNFSLGLSCDDYVAWLQAFAVEEMTEDEAVALVDGVGFPPMVRMLRELATNYVGDLGGEGENPPKAA